MKHIHFHFPPTGDIPSSFFNQLKALITMEMAQLKTVLGEIAGTLAANTTTLAENGTTLAKSFDELIVKIGGIGQTDAETDALITSIKEGLAAQATALAAQGKVAKDLDDLVPDAPPVA